MSASRETGSTAEFLQHLVDERVLSREGAERAVQAQTSTNHPIDVILTELGLLREDELVARMAEYLERPKLARLPALNLELVGSAGLHLLDRYAVVPLWVEDEALHLCVCDPFVHEGIDALAFHFDRSPILHIAARSTIAAHLKDARASYEGEKEEGPASEPFAETDDIERLRDIAREAPVVRLVSKIISEAADRGATDIHIEPQEDHVRIRIRLDGILLPIETAPRAMLAGLVTRIKIMAQLNIAERRLPQDGRMRVAVRGQNIDLRVSVVPSAHGESIVLRLLDRSRVKLELASLGFDHDTRQRLTSMVHSANGIMLITGPTGSGKTTSLYALLKERNAEDTKIFTVEDPIEYKLPGVTQLQVEPAIDLNFATALRSVLRQDPDVILVGEIRDRETAEIAIRAALTGHLVLSTLHTNNAASAFTRLRDIGIDSYLLGATIRGVLSQRLLRQQCQHCHGSGAAQTGTCIKCDGKGYSGRTVAYELLSVSKRISDLVNGGAHEDTIQEVAAEEGMIALREHARSLVQMEVTTEEEITRVIDLGGS
ncbi:GspE/PulE family protein [Nitratireductor sp. ZSWI3]|uniref:GspE/PulE family protein n=1 Tax=Nitratireductor sp. ZSWI3 TaxID=2966359 RepID=UPI00214FBC30|nr:GspE/PulE family protein [Nitratireductor sp. ZSWI3]MCR4265788.1 GspE/PulE family protein [Nitratireductor sp. ZSWI3]